MRCNRYSYMPDYFEDPNVLPPRFHGSIRLPDSAMNQVERLLEASINVADETSEYLRGRIFIHLIFLGSIIFLA